jgi:hypothetical protein
MNEEAFERIQMICGYLIAASGESSNQISHKNPWQVISACFKLR